MGEQDIKFKGPMSSQVVIEYATTTHIPVRVSREGWVVLIEKDLAMVARVRVVLAWILGCHPAGGPGADG